MGYVLAVLIVLTIFLLAQVSAIRRMLERREADIALIKEHLLRLRNEPCKRPPPEAVEPAAPGTAAAQEEPRRAPEERFPPPAPAPKPAVPPPLPAAGMPPPVAAASGALAAPDPVSSPAAAKPPSRLGQSVGDILSRIWQWILVGEEYRPANVALEYAVATTWLMRAGIVMVVTFVGFFLKWSIDQGLLTPPMRVALSILFGLAMLVGGMRLLGRRWHVLAQGFVGGGLAVLYFSMYAMGPLYRLVESRTAVFALMSLVTLAAGLLSLRANSMLVAIFGLIGGFWTPVLLRTGTPQFAVLFSYLLLLNLGIVGIAQLRPWRLLNYLGFVCTYALFFGSLWGQYEQADFPVAIAFLTAFFLTHSLLIVVYNLRCAVRTTPLEITHLLLNAALYSATAYHLIVDAAGRPWPALLALGLALFFILQTALFLRRGLPDRPLLLSLISLAGLFTTLTMPLAMEKESLTIGWAMLAFMFLWLGRRLPSNYLRHLGYAVYLITFVRLLAIEMPRVEWAAPPHAAMAPYWHALAARLWTFGLSIGSIVCAWWIERRPAACAGQPASPSAAGDLPTLLPSTAARHAFFWVMVLCAFVYLHRELFAMFGAFTPLRPAVLTWLWCGAAVAFLARYRGEGSPAMGAALAIFVAGAVIKTLFVDLRVWDLDARFVFDAEYTLFDAAMRWLDLAAVLALLLAGWAALRQRRPEAAMPQVFGYAGLALLWLYMSLETNSLLHWKLPKFQTGGLSVLWTLFALAFVAGGIWRNARGVRFAGLALFAVVVGKAFLVDLAQMPTLFRVIAFMAVGALLLLGSFAYLRAGARFPSNIAGGKKCVRDS